jgi:hypothetical protein
MDIFETLFCRRDIAEAKKNNAKERRIRSEARLWDAQKESALSQQGFEEAHLEARRTLVRKEFEARTDLAFLEADLRTRLAEAVATAEDAQRRVQVRSHARTLSYTEALAFLQGESAREQAIGEYDAMLRILRGGDNSRGGDTRRSLPAPPPVASLPLPPRALPPPPQPDPPLPDPPIQRRLSTEDIERHALQAVIRIGGLPQEQQEATWVEWRRRLHSTHSPLVAEEIEKRAEALRGATT